MTRKVRSNGNGSNSENTPRGYGLTLDEIGNIPILLFYGTLGYIPILMPNLGGAATNQTQSDQVHGINHIVLFFVWGLIFLFMLKGHFKLRMDLFVARLALLYGAFTLLSELWCTPMFGTVSGAVGLLISTFYSIYLVKKYPRGRLVIIFSWMFLVIAVLTAIFALLLPSYGIDHFVHAGAWQGIYGQKNTLGLAMTFGTAITLSLDPKNAVERIFKYGLLFLCLAEAGLSESREAWIACALILMVDFFLNIYNRFALSSRSALLSIGGGIALFTGFIVATNWVTILTALGRDPTLTGRTQLWAAVIEQIRRRPFGGYGLGSFWASPDAQQVYSAVAWRPTSAHNGYLECMLELGGIGLLMLLWVLGSAFRNATKVVVGKRTFQSSKGWIYCIVAITFLNFTANVTGIVNSISWILLICGACELEIETRALRSQVRTRKNVTSQSLSTLSAAGQA